MTRPDALLAHVAHRLPEAGSYMLLLRADVAMLLAWVRELEGART
jgi:hypothetical protein